MFRCNRWSEAELFASREVWQSLLARAGADPVFMSWEWITCWWRRHSSSLGADLCVLGITDENGELVGVAPLYTHAARHGRWLRTRRLQVIGSCWRGGTAVFSEYLDILALPARREAVVAALAAELRADRGWDELVMANIRRDSVAESLGQALRAHAYLRCADDLQAWALDIAPGFERFLDGLDSNTRRKLFNQRQKLADIEYVVLAPAQWRAALDRLDAFLAERWRRANAGIIRAFHEDLIAALPETRVRLSALTTAGKCLSVMLNLRAGDTEYYLQSAFDSSFSRGLSPGYLHLGHAIESACRDGVRRFDLLAGRGLHRDYKRDLATKATPLRTLHLVRRRPLRALFRVADLLRGRTGVTSPTGDSRSAGATRAESFTLAG
jgi:CelD/BcsL family acetyltransferase involved in cellulose biosynthesis